MDATVQKMDAQLMRCKSKIDMLTSRAQTAGVGTRFDNLQYIDELKALHTIAQTKFDALKATKAPERERCEVEMNRAWHELDGAVRNPRPSV